MEKMEDKQKPQEDSSVGSEATSTSNDTVTGEHFVKVSLCYSANFIFLGNQNGFY